MKLLLTSGGITNKTIADALLDLVGKKAEEINIAFIPTAVNANPSHKGWFIDDLRRIKEQKYKMIDIVDISALPKEVWKERLEVADVLFFSGGVTPHLMYWIEESGLKKLLPELLKTRVWAGISAGSVVVSPTLAFSKKSSVASYKEKFGHEPRNGLGFVDFYIRPHLNSPDSPQARKILIEEIAKEVEGVVYALDDQMALKVVDGKMEVIGEGEYLVFNK